MKNFYNFGLSFAALSRALLYPTKTERKWSHPEYQDLPKDKSGLVLKPGTDTRDSKYLHSAARRRREEGNGSSGN